MTVTMKPLAGRPGTRAVYLVGVHVGYIQTRTGDRAFYKRVGDADWKHSPEGVSEALRRLLAPLKKAS